MADPVIETSASRLLKVVDDLRTYSRNSPVRHAVAQALEVDEDDEPRLLRHIATVMDLPAELRVDLQAAVTDPQMASLTLDPLSELDDTLAGLTSWSTSLAVVTDRLTPLVRHMLLSAHVQITGAGLSRTRASDEDVSALLERVNELVAEVLESDLPANFREFLIRHLATIRQALEDVAVTGVDGVEAAVERAVGGLVMTGRQEGPRDGDGDDARTWWSRFMQTVRDALTLGQAGEKAVGLGQAASQLELPPSIFGG